MVDELSKHVLALQQLFPKESIDAENEIRVNMSEAALGTKVSESVMDLSSLSCQSNVNNARPPTSNSDIGDMDKCIVSEAGISSQEVAGVLGPLAGSGCSEDTSTTSVTSESLKSVSWEVDKVTHTTLVEDVIKNSKTLVHKESVVAPTILADSDAIHSDVPELPQNSRQGITAHSVVKISSELTSQPRSKLSPEEKRQPVGSSSASHTGDHDEISVESPMPEDKGKHITQIKLSTNGLLADIQAMFMKSAEYSDFSILCGGMTFPCHEFILRARSTVLDSMFQNEITETSARSMNVNDVGPNTMAAVLEFMYTEGITKEVDSVKEVLYIADKYNLKGLLELCLRKLPEVEDHMVVEFLFMAHKHNFIDFKKEAMLRINQDKSKYIDDQNFMDKIMKVPNLLLELYKL